MLDRQTFFRALLKHHIRPYLGKILCIASKFLKKKRTRKVVFWSVEAKIKHFFGAHCLSKLKYIGVLVSIKKFRVGRTKKDIIKIVAKGDPLFGGEGVELSLHEKKRPQYPPLNWPLIYVLS